MMPSSGSAFVIASEARQSGGWRQDLDCRGALPLAMTGKAAAIVLYSRSTMVTLAMPPPSHIV